MTIYHNHHIIPRHMGGSNDPQNLVKLTVEEHAKSHQILYDTYGKLEDFIAWKALSGQILMSDASKLAHLLGSYRGGYAKKPNNVPAHNKIEFYCVGCQKRIKPSAKGHILCVQKKFNLIPKLNIGKFNSKIGKKMAEQNNSTVACPNCNKIGQYRAMKRWHFDNCKS
jgi:hypothetical protein